MTDYLNDWYYMLPNRQGRNFVRGPLSITEMRDLLDKGDIDRKTQVRCGTSSFWHPAEDVLPILTQSARRATEAGSIRTRSPGIRKATTVLVVVLVLVCIIAAARWRLSSITHAPFQGVPSQEHLSKERIIGLTNNVRTTNGLGAVVENPLLDAIAEERAKDMFEKQYFAHVSPTGEQASDIAQRVGYRYKIIAENIASGLFLTNQKLVDSWVQSPGHRKNILLTEVREMGASVVKGKMDGGETYVSVQIFGLQSPHVSEQPCALPSRDLLSDIEAKKTEIGSLNTRLTRLKQELDAENAAIESDRRNVGVDPKRNYDLNVKIRGYNEKSAWHNQSLAEINGKAAVLTSMVEEYNRAVQAYGDCSASR